MTEQFIVRDTDRGNEKTVDSRREAEARKQDLLKLGVDEQHIEIIPPNDAATDGGQAGEANPVADTPADDDLPDDPPIDQDPVNWLPSHFVDEIQGVPTVNRKGYAVIASKYGITVEAEPITLPSETGFEHAEFEATAETPDGERYSGFGSAHVDRDDGDDPHLLGELAETRAMKRAVAWASGVGLTAIEELQGDRA